MYVYLQCVYTYIHTQICNSMPIHTLVTGPSSKQVPSGGVFPASAREVPRRSWESDCFFGEYINNYVTIDVIIDVLLSTVLPRTGVIYENIIDRENSTLFAGYLKSNMMVPANLRTAAQFQRWAR